MKKGSPLRWWLRTAAIVCVVVIGWLSLVPGQYQSRSGLSSQLEHVAAYLGTAMLFGLGWQGGLGRKTAIAILLIAYSGLMELLQNFSPGRHPEVEGVLTGGVGVLLGSALALIIDRAWHQS